MPNFDYTTNNNQGTTANLRTKASFKFEPKKLLVIALIFVVTILTLVLSTVLAGALSAIGGNITTVDLSLLFDPSITTAYILVYYLVSHFNYLTAKQSYLFFLLSLFLSFTVNFVSGAIMLVSLPVILQKFKLIEVAKKV